jgi:hypothetical protein
MNECASELIQSSRSDDDAGHNNNHEDGCAYMALVLTLVECIDTIHQSNLSLGTKENSLHI